MSASNRSALVALAAALSCGGCASLTGPCTSPACADDARILSDVERRFYELPSLRFFNIHVSTHDRAVYLYGLVDTRADFERAEQVAGAVPGVKKVYNGLGLNGNSWH